MKCERCEGEGLVVTWRRRPLWCGPSTGMRVIREIAAGKHSRKLERCDDIGLAIKLMFDAKARPVEAFLPVSCPDCDGAGDVPDLEPWTVEQVA